MRGFCAAAASEGNIHLCWRLRGAASSVVTYSEEEVAKVAQDAVKVFDDRFSGWEGEGPELKMQEKKKVGRNDPCPCGSGKKYKNCHGAR